MEMGIYGGVGLFVGFWFGMVFRTVSLVHVAIAAVLLVIVASELIGYFGFGNRFKDYRWPIYLFSSVTGLMFFVGVAVAAFLVVAAPKLV